MDTRKLRKFILVGVPRSGTTIVARVLGAHPGVRLLSEPHWEAKMNNFTFKNFPDATYDQSDPTPMDLYFTRQLTRFDYVGFKETYRRDDIYERSPMGRLIHAYCEHPDYAKVFVVRDPVTCFASTQSHGKLMHMDDGGECDLGRFLANYESMLDLAVKYNCKPIVLERFAEDPLAELAGKLPFAFEAMPELTNEVEGKGKPPGLGDWGAWQSTELKVDKRELSKRWQLEHILGSAAKRRYDALNLISDLNAAQAPTQLPARS
jgi:Sulfotransferase family